MLRVLPGGMLIPRSATALGTTNAPLDPARPRAIDRPTIFCMKPLIRCHNTHHASAPRSVLLWPKIDPNRPPARTNAPCVSLRR
ncbi:hypothetical protein BDP55DRAFT_668895, partial [Colletotrichum godetiae]